MFSQHVENIKHKTCLRPYDSQVRLSFFLEMWGPLECKRETERKTERLVFKQTNKQIFNNCKAVFLVFNQVSHLVGAAKQVCSFLLNQKVFMLYCAYNKWKKQGKDLQHTKQTAYVQIIYINKIKMSAKDDKKFVVHGCKKTFTSRNFLKFFYAVSFIFCILMLLSF